MLRDEKERGGMGAERGNAPEIPDHSPGLNDNHDNP
jgi:hypothetical protein